LHINNLSTLPWDTFWVPNIPKNAFGAGALLRTQGQKKRKEVEEKKGNRTGREERRRIGATCNG